MVWFQHIWHLFNPLPPPVVALDVFSGSSQLKGIFYCCLGSFFVRSTKRFGNNYLTLRSRFPTPCDKKSTDKKSTGLFCHILPFTWVKQTFTLQRAKKKRRHIPALFLTVVTVLANEPTLPPPRV